MNMQLVSSTCNYVSDPDVEVKAKRPIGRCVADYTKVQSKYYNCSSSGSSVTAYTFYGSTSCDFEEAQGVLTDTITTFGADIECNGTNDCDICWRVYNNCNERSISNAYEECYINDECSDTSTLEYKVVGKVFLETKRSHRVNCTSNGEWTVSEYAENKNCARNETTTTLSDGCIDGIYYEMITSPCMSSDSHGVRIDFEARIYFAMFIVCMFVFFPK